jgi:Flp pilus assembly pilin Flp
VCRGHDSSGLVDGGVFSEGSAAMNSIFRKSVQFLKSDDGPTVTEYAVLIAVICVAVIGALSSFGVHMDNMYMSIASTVPVGSGS